MKLFDYEYLSPEALSGFDNYKVSIAFLYVSVCFVEVSLFVNDVNLNKHVMLS